MLERPKISIIEEQRGEYKAVVVYNADGKARQEKLFRSQAEAHQFWLGENARLRDQM